MIHKVKTLALLVARGNEGANTHELRNAIGQMSPAARILELKNAGAVIETILTTVKIEGKPHKRVARYVLVSMPKHLAHLLPKNKKGGK